MTDHEPIRCSERLPELLPPEGSLALSYSAEVEICMGIRYDDGRFTTFHWQNAYLASEAEYKQPELHWILSDSDCDNRVELADVPYWVPKWNRPLPADIESFAEPAWSPERQARERQLREAEEFARRNAPLPPGCVRVSRDDIVFDGAADLILGNSVIYHKGGNDGAASTREDILNDKNLHPSEQNYGITGQSHAEKNQEPKNETKDGAR